MFIYSIRASTVKLFSVIALTLVLLVTAVIFGGGETAMASADGEINFGGMKTNEDRVSFIESFGVKVEKDPIEEEAFTLPKNFDRIISGYNELQKKQNLDITKYQNKRITRYTYKVINYDHDGDVYVNLFVYRSKIVACDISSASPTGFVTPLTLVEKSKLK